MSTDDLRLTQRPSTSTGMLIRRPPTDVFRAIVDPSVTTRFWFTKSSGKLALGATVRWEWEMYGASTTVRVREFEENKRLVAEWGPESAATTFSITLTPWRDETTYVKITETGFTGSADEVVARVIDSTGGFTSMLCAMKALLEHDVVLRVVLDKMPAGLKV